MARNYRDFPNEYNDFKVGDRFRATFLGMTLIYRVVKIEIQKVKYKNEIHEEPIVTTKSGLVWTTHICGALLDFFGRGGADYTPSPAIKTWVSSYYKVAKNERTLEEYALGEE